MSPATEERLGRLRGRVPTAAIPALVAARTRLAWSREAVREDARAQMGFLLEHTNPEADLDEVARAYVRYQAWRGESRWHPELISDLPIRGFGHLAAARKQGHGVIVSFMHHAHYEGAFASIARSGISAQVVVYPYMLRDDAPTWLKQHLNVAISGGARVISAGIGTDALTGLLREGEVVGIASDVPGHTPVRFVGRDVVGSYGAARLSAATSAPVVVMTSEPGDHGPVVRLHEPLQPEGYDSAKHLLQAMLDLHETAVVRWPEATDLPLSRWALPEVPTQAPARVPAQVPAQAPTHAKDTTRLGTRVAS